MKYGRRNDVRMHGISLYRVCDSACYTVLTEVLGQLYSLNLYFLQEDSRHRNGGRSYSESFCILD